MSFSTQNLSRHVKHASFAVALVALLSCSFAGGALAKSDTQNTLNIVSEINHQVGMLSYQIPNATVRISALTDTSFEVFYEPNNSRQLPSFALAEKQKQVTTSVNATSTYIEFFTPKSYVQLNPKTGQLAFGLNNEPVVVEEEVGLFFTETLRGFRFKLDDGEQLMGGGQRVLGMDRRGHRMPLYNRAHYGYTTESNQMYYSLPAVLSNQDYALLFDNSANGFLDIGHSQKDILQFEAVAGRTSYIVVLGDDIKQVSQEIAQVTGKQPLPPRWALGNFASRFGYRTQQETQDTVQAFADADIPLDAVVLDLYWFGSDIKGHMGNLDWDLNAFPQPEKMIQGFTEQGVNTIVITEPFILSSSKQWDSAVENQALAKNYSGEPRRFDFYFGNTGLVDVFDTDAQRWFNQFYTKLYDQGVTGWWGDLGEPEVHPADSLHEFGDLTVTGDEIHNVYGHQWAKMVYEHQRQLDPLIRPFVMMRAGFLGSQRYGLIPWTGDVSREWGGLVPQVELALQMSVLGLGYIHSDVGGFAGGEIFDPELYMRWTQFGAFSPVFRPHAQEHIPSEPVFHKKAVKDHSRDYIKLRYALTPYNYTLAMEHSLTGMPLMRPVSFLDSDQFTQSASYLWGDSLLVHPVTAPNITTVSVDLPAGVWFDYFDGQRFVGDQIVKVAAPLHKLPLLVKAGAFVPMVDATQHLKHYSTQNLTMHYYHDKSVISSHYRLLEDDGVAPDSIINNDYQSIHFSSVATESIVAIDAQVQGMYATAPESRAMTYVIHNIDALPAAIKINDRVLSDNERQRAWNSDTREVRVAVDLMQGVALVVTL